MKLGPLHVLTDATFRRLHALQDLWGQFSRALEAAARAGNPLADRVYEHSHGFLHSPLGARAAPASLPPEPAVTAADLAAAERVCAAYRLAGKDHADPPAPGLWDHIGREKQGFLAALDKGDVPAVAAALARMFVTELTWGLGLVHADHPDLLRSPEPTHLHVLFTDKLVALAEAVGAARVTNVHQVAADHLHPLDRDLEPLYAATVGRLGFAPAYPAVGCAYGFRLGGDLVTPDGLVHAYTAHRARQLHGGPGATVFEIGGGYGGLALLSHRSGVGGHTIFDLPWVNALQGYFLIRSLPEGTVQLYGESTGAVRVSPYWALDREPDRSCDVLVNTDSLPEMGHATAAGYVPKIRRVVRGAFLSINQEAGAEVIDGSRQGCVRELVDAAGGFALRSRHPAWMRHGYVEEVWGPA